MIELAINFARKKANVFLCNVGHRNVRARDIPENVFYSFFPEDEIAELKRQILLIADRGFDTKNISHFLIDQEEFSITKDSQGTGETPSAPGDDNSGYGDR